MCDLPCQWPCMTMMDSILFFNPKKYKPYYLLNDYQFESENFSRLFKVHIKSQKENIQNISQWQTWLSKQ